MSFFLQITLWVFASAGVSLIAGYFIGRARASHQLAEQAAPSVQVLTVFAEVLRDLETMTAQVDSRNTEIRAVGRKLSDLPVQGDLNNIKTQLLEHITAVVRNNQQLEDDLIHTQSKMEEQAVELDRTRKEAQLDALSGAFCRKVFDDKLRLMLGNWRRERSIFTLILVDLDHFKWINDTHGHVMGDRVLREMGALLNRAVRPGDFVCRYGGDEFALLLPQAPFETGMAVAKRLHELTTRTNFGVGVKSEQAALTLSIGVTVVAHGDNAERIIARADRALYAAKKGGRNQVQGEPAPATNDATDEAATLPVAAAAVVGSKTFMEDLRATTA